MTKKIVGMAMTTVGWAAAVPAMAQVNTKINLNGSGIGTNSPETIVVNLINVVLGLLTIVAVVLVLVGGFKWMTAAGNEEKVEGARKLLIAAVIGLLIVLAAWGLSLYAIGVLAGVTGGTPV